MKGKIALVTGGSRGIGREIALKLASEGADVIINYFRRRQEAEETLLRLKEMGVRGEVTRANLAEPEKIKAMFAEIEKNFGKLDIFISNAASGVARSVLDIDEKAWEWTMNINARAYLLCAKEASRLMGERGGKIVAISSLGSSLVWSGYAAVGISKAALEAITRYLAIELAPLNICVNAVAASAVETEALKVYLKEEQAPTTSRMKITPAGRMVTPSDVANVVCFLCQEESFMIRGQTIIVDGGQSLALS